MNPFYPPPPTCNHVGMGASGRVPASSTLTDGVMRQTYLLKLARSGEDGEKVFLVLESGTRFHTTQVQRFPLLNNSIGMAQTDADVSLPGTCSASLDAVLAFTAVTLCCTHEVAHRYYAWTLWLLPLCYAMQIRARPRPDQHTIAVLRAP